MSTVAMGVGKMIGRILLVCFIVIVFLFSGLIVNFLQFLLYISLYDRARNLYRKINYYLIYTTWTQIVAIGHWWSGSRVRRWGDVEDLNMFGREHCLVIMNHKYDNDWLMCWLTVEDLKMLGNAKSCAKKSLSKVPVIGWGWIFGEMIFLERNWELDKKTLGGKLDNLASYEDPVMILYFCEGTRFTPEKHKASVEFAKARNLPILQHHLTPRTRGFNFTAKHLKNKISAVYDVELAFPDGPVKPTFLNMLRGHSFVGDMHIKRYPISEIPTDSDESLSKWLHELYQKKDKLVDDYKKTGRFPGACIKVHPRLHPLLHLLFWSAVVGVPFTKLLISFFTMGSMFATSVALSIVVLLFTIMYIMVRATSSAKGSSYGKDSSPKKSTNGTLNCEKTNGNFNNLSESSEHEISDKSSNANRISEQLDSSS